MRPDDGVAQDTAARPDHQTPGDGGFNGCIELSMQGRPLVASKGGRAIEVSYEGHELTLPSIERALCPAQPCQR
jgi:hypothetical protein